MDARAKSVSFLRSIFDIEESLYLLRLSLPIITTQLTRIGMVVIDIVMVGHFSTPDLAGISLASALWGPIFSFAFGLLMMLSADIAKFRVGQQTFKIVEVTSGYISIGVLFSAVCIVMLLNASHLLLWIGTEADISALAQGYLNFIALGVPGILLFNILRSFLQGFENTKLPMYVAVVSFVFNVPLNYIFIYGKLGLPPMGAAGAGLATALISTLNALYLLFYCFKKEQYRSYFSSFIILPWRHLCQILAVALPSGLAFFAESLFLDVVALLVASLGAEIIAAYHIVLNIGTVIFMVISGFAAGITVRVSTHAVTSTRKAFLTGRTGLVLAFGIALFASMIIYVFALQILHLYSGDLKVVNAALKIMPVLCLFLFFDSAQSMLGGILRGLHQVKVIFIIPMLGYWVIGFPSALFLGFSDMIPARFSGIWGIWTGVTVGFGANALLLFLWLRVLEVNKLQNK